MSSLIPQSREENHIDTQILRENPTWSFSFFYFSFISPQSLFKPLVWCPLPMLPIKKLLTGHGNAGLQISPFLYFKSSSLMFGQHINHGFPVSRLCWLYRERVRGEPNLLRETMMIGATVQVQTSKEWRPPPKQICFST